MPDEASNACLLLIRGGTLGGDFVSYQAPQELRIPRLLEKCRRNEPNKKQIVVRL